MSFVSPKLNLPIFLISRNRIKWHGLSKLRNYIKRRRRTYISACPPKGADDDGSQPEDEKGAGGSKYGEVKGNCGQLRSLKISRELTVLNSWNLAPNRYHIPSELFFHRKGQLGAYWAKNNLSGRAPTAAKQDQSSLTNFYNLPRDSERFGKSCFQHKGTFPINARAKRPTTRIMVSDLSTCWRNPKDPTPTSYYLGHFDLINNVSPPLKVTPTRPYKFLRNSCVPLKDNSIHRKNISFEAGPGRYDIYDKRNLGCPCSARLIYEPDINLRIEHEKRLKFRRLQYKKINTKRYCTPVWRHIKGHGFRYLFRIPKVPPTSTKDTTKKSDHPPDKIYANARYISMLTNPKRTDFTFHDRKLPELPFKLTYNCMAKRIIRRQLRANKKIAFLSGKHRWPDTDGFRMPAAAAAAARLENWQVPEDRQLRDRPVMRISKLEISSKLNELPQRLRGTLMEHRKRPFKFLPLPGAKILVTDTDIMRQATATSHEFYGKALQPSSYFKDE